VTEPACCFPGAGQLPGRVAWSLPTEEGRKESCHRLLEHARQPDDLPTPPLIALRGPSLAACDALANGMCLRHTAAAAAVV